MYKLKLSLMGKIYLLTKLGFVCVLCVLTLSACDDIDGILADYGETDTETDNSTDFVNDADGWMIEGDASKVEAEYSSDNGLDGSGYIFAKDNVTGGVWYFVAPSKYLEDKSRFYNGYLRFYLLQESDFSSQFIREDIIIDGGEAGSLVYYFDSFPGNTWTKYQINMNTTDSWYDGNGTLASNSHIKNVLSSIQSLKIRGEFESGPDTGGLDSFAFVR